MLWIIEGIWTNKTKIHYTIGVILWLYKIKETTEKPLIKITPKLIQSPYVHRDFEIVVIDVVLIQKVLR